MGSLFWEVLGLDCGEGGNKALEEEGTTGSITNFFDLVLDFETGVFKLVDFPDGVCFPGFTVVAGLMEKVESVSWSCFNSAVDVRLSSTALTTNLCASSWHVSEK